MTERSLSDELKSIKASVKYQQQVELILMRQLLALDPADFVTLPVSYVQALILELQERMAHTTT